jgi:hypothetical protein
LVVPTLINLNLSRQNIIVLTDTPDKPATTLLTYRKTGYGENNQ